MTLPREHTGSVARDAAVGLAFLIAFAVLMLIG